MGHGSRPPRSGPPRGPDHRSAPGARRARYDVFFREGLAKLEARDFDGAIESFRRAIAIDPGPAAAYYDIACAHALRGDAERAVDWLAEATAHGFRDGAHIDRDRDLDPIRDAPAFRALRSRARSGAGRR